jgi:hypothetical protein
MEWNNFVIVSHRKMDQGHLVFQLGLKKGKIQIKNDNFT